jgi:seryl-tRNA synthetase
MIDVKHLVENLDLYVRELEIRNKDAELAIQARDTYLKWKEFQSKYDTLKQEQNEFNKKVVSLSGEEKAEAIAKVKDLSLQVKIVEADTREFKLSLDQTVAKIPNLSWSGIPIGKTDADNPVVKTWGQKPVFDFSPRHYHQLPWYEKYVAQKEGTVAMGSRGYFMRGEIAKFQRALFQYAEDTILKYGLELFYVPLMLNEKTMTDIGNLPDFDGQLYEVKIEEDKNYYLIPSSEQSLMGFYAGKNLGELTSPELVAANTTCFRKEAGSYGRDQQGILRVHQFQKIEMDAICRPEDNQKIFDLFAEINEEIYSSLGLHYRAVEVCSGDMPAKHHRQVDYEAWFPAEEKYREIGSNGSASDYQNRGLKVFYTENGLNKVPWSLNCTGMTFRTGLAILEQFQTADGSVLLPEVLHSYFGNSFLS